MGLGKRYSSYDASYEQNQPSYDDQFADPVDLDAFGSQLRAQRPARSLATREEFLPDDSVPLFLAGSDEENLTPRFGRPPKRGFSRLLKAGAFVLAATIATFVAVKNPFTVFANATASLMGTSDVRPAPAPAPAAQPPSAQASNQLAPAAPSVAAAVPSVAAAAPASAAQAPSRDEIAIALRNAHQSAAPPEAPPPAAPVAVAAVAPVAVVAPVTPVAPVVAAPPVRRLPPDEIATLMTRGKALLASGDIPPARLLLERAAEAGEANAALMLAQTYDPAVLGTQDARNITPDPAMARNWYQRAAQLGSADAQRRLSQLQ